MTRIRLDDERWKVERGATAMKDWIVWIGGLSCLVLFCHD